MKAFGLGLAILVGGVLCVGVAVRSQAAPLTIQQRRSLVEVQREVAKAASYLRRRDFDRAEKTLNAAEKQFDEILKDSKVDEKERSVATIRNAIRQQRAELARRRNPGQEGGKEGTAPAGPKEVSFTKEIGPILEDRCVRCHGENRPRANVSLASFADIKKSNGGNKLFTAGQPRQSSLLARLTARGPQRMPKNGPPLSAEEIEKFQIWIAQGAKFDGKDETTAVGKEEPKVAAAFAPTGKETVSFTKDIAPFMSNLCVRCHRGNNPRGGLSLETFDKMMAGGQSGRVILPGNVENSKLRQLVVKQVPIKMPPGNALITRTNANNLDTWILEGAKYDGGNPNKTLRELVPTEEDIQAMELAKFTDEEFIAYRRTHTDEQWDRVLPKDRPRWAESDDFLVYGNVTTERLTEISNWAEQHADDLRKLFGSKADRLWKGKLTVFVFKDRFGFDEFHTVIQDRRIPRDLVGSSTVDADFANAYVVLEDVGDDDTGNSPGLRLSLIEQVTGAYLKRTGGDLPDWLVSGLGLSLVGRSDDENVYLEKLRARAPDMVHSLTDPELVFASGTFAPGAVPAVGLTLVEFLEKAGGGPERFSQFVKRMQQGDTVAAAMKAVYNADAKSVAAQFSSQLKKPRR